MPRSPLMWSPRLSADEVDAARRQLEGVALANRVRVLLKWDGERSQRCWTVAYAATDEEDIGRVDVKDPAAALAWLADVLVEPAANVGACGASSCALGAWRLALFMFDGRPDAEHAGWRLHATDEAGFVTECALDAARFQALFG